MINVRIKDENKYMKIQKELSSKMDDSFVSERMYEIIRDDWKKSLESPEESVAIEIPPLTHESRMMIIALFLDIFHRHGKVVYFKYRKSSVLLGVISK